MRHYAVGLVCLALASCGTTTTRTVTVETPVEVKVPVRQPCLVPNVLFNPDPLPVDLIPISTPADDLLRAVLASFDQLESDNAMLRRALGMCVKGGGI